jgi:hypothetical protein
LTHKDGYKPVLILAVLAPLFTNAIALVVTAALY